MSNTIQNTLPHKMGLDEAKIKRALAMLERSVDEGRIPGFVTAIGRNGKIAIMEAGGYASVLQGKKTMRVDTVFDIASVTKVVVTTSAVMLTMEQGLLCLDDPVKKYIPLFTGGYKDIITIRHLLTHTSGLITQPEFHHDYNHKKSLFKALISAPLIFKPGTTFNYTCTGFHLLGEVIKVVSGMRLDKYIDQYLFTPLAMNDSTFNPGELLAQRAASTEFCRWRKKIVAGQVHDENCFVFGGVSGNAGLFTTALDLSKFAMMLLAGGKEGGSQLLARSTINLMWQNHTPGLEQKRGLGWAIEHQAFGDLMPGNVGHTGFTGCSLCLWPDAKLFVVLLTNRVHYGRENDWIDEIRPRFHNMVAASIID